MQFSELLHRVRHEALDIQVDSRLVSKGQVFVALAGAKDNGSKYMLSALEAGAAYVVCLPEYAQDAVLCQRAAEMGASVMAHAKPREALWQLAQARYKTDTLTLKVLGITGTNGKTTIAYLLEHLFTSMGQRVGVLGTVNYRWPGHVEAASLTTPDALHIHKYLAAMQADGVEVAILEVSSHALDQERVGGVVFAGAIFTNLTQDHLDYHENMDSYFAAKAVLFTQLPDLQKVCVINADDVWGQKLLTLCPHAFSYGLHAKAPNAVAATPHTHMWGHVRAMSATGLELALSFAGQQWELRSPLVGTYNAANLLAVQTLALGLGACPEDMQCLHDFYGVSGRLERVPNAQGLNIFVDYAHTPDALVNVLSALRGAGFTRVITVFGCGGNRDTRKRPLMGQAAAQYSDMVVLTSDNPRFEDPQAIINDVLAGIPQDTMLVVEPDRRAAIALALSHMQEGDALCIAGKGHEEYQLIQGVKHIFSDQQTVRELLACK